MEKRRLKKRAVVLTLVWLVLLVLSLFLLSAVLSAFLHNPQGEVVASLSWAGYIVTSSSNANAKVTQVSGSWVVPTVNVSAGNSYASVWLGIGGDLDTTLIQVGTENTMVNGQATYYAWYELLPNLAVTLNTLTISPGDVMSASIRLLNSATNQWSIEIVDTTTGQTFGTTVTYDSTRSSGEWIVERPTTNSMLTTLADFGNVTFTNCHITTNKTSGQIGRFYYTRLEMTNNSGGQLAFASNLAADGTSFTVSYVPTH